MSIEPISKTKILEEIKNHIKRISDFGVKKIGLFGSYRHGTQTASSDIDILVEFQESQETFDNYMDLKFYLEDLFQQKIDLVIKETLKPRIKQNILETVEYA